MSQMPPVFIVFTRDTFQLLKLSVYSLQAHSSLHYTIVCNGMALDEVAEVEAFCRHFDRVDFLDFPSAGRMLPHGTVIQLLFDQTDGELFSFADSDVFALAPFQDDFESAVKGADIVSIADHPVQEGRPQHVGTGGCATVSPGGLQLANTFFAVYRRASVRQIMDETLVSIERYQRFSQVPARAQAQLPSQDRDRGHFDTGKLLCALASQRGYAVSHQPLSQLFHMGRMSVRALGDDEKLPDRLRRKRVLREFLGEFMQGLKSGSQTALPILEDAAVNQMLAEACPALAHMHSRMEVALSSEPCLEQNRATDLS